MVKVNKKRKEREAEVVAELTTHIDKGSHSLPYKSINHYHHHYHYHSLIYRDKETIVITKG